jgi:Na+/glutamate symporter
MTPGRRSAGLLAQRLARGASHVFVVAFVLCAAAKWAGWALWVPLAWIAAGLMVAGLAGGPVARWLLAAAEPQGGQAPTDT